MSPSRPRRLLEFLLQKYERIPKTRRHAMVAAAFLLWIAVVGAVLGMVAIHRHGPKRPHPDDTPTTTTTSPPPAGSSNTLSYQMARSIMARRQGMMDRATSPGDPGAALEAGIVQKALAAYTSYHGTTTTPEIQAYIEHSTAAAAALMADGGAPLALARWPLDRLAAGNAMLADTSGDPAVAAGLAALRESVRLNGATPDDGDSAMWYWHASPGWASLDGAYGLGPFAAADGDVATALPQLDLLWAHTRDAGTGLLAHGYHHDTGTAKKVGAAWARGMGWFLMAAADTLELAWPAWRGGSADWAGAGVPDHQVPLLRGLRGMYVSLAAAVLRHADEDGSGGWLRVVGGREGNNTVESSATAMFVYALLKGARLGYLGPEDVVVARKVGLAAHAVLVERFVSVGEDGGGLLDWAGTVDVSGLDSSADYEYYVGRPEVPNSAIGAAAFVLASVEVERLGGGGAVDSI